MGRGGAGATQQRTVEEEELRKARRKAAAAIRRPPFEAASAFISSPSWTAARSAESGHRQIARCRREHARTKLPAPAARSALRRSLRDKTIEKQDSVDVSRLSGRLDMAGFRKRFPKSL